jgi:hypothetical protein
VGADFWNLNRKIYYYKDNLGEEQVGGYYRQKGNFTLMTVPKAGHFMPHDNFYATKSFLDDFVSSGSLICHKVNKICDTVQTMCKAMNNCNNGTCLSNGQCQCNGMTVKGADCSK